MALSWGSNGSAPIGSPCSSAVTIVNTPTTVDRAFATRLLHVWKDKLVENFGNETLGEVNGAFRMNSASGDGVSDTPSVSSRTVFSLIAPLLLSIDSWKNEDLKGACADPVGCADCWESAVFAVYGAVHPCVGRKDGVLPVLSNEYDNPTGFLICGGVVNPLCEVPEPPLAGLVRGGKELLPLCCGVPLVWPK